MKLQYIDAKLTDELERDLIQREIDSDTSRDSTSTSVLLLQVVVGTLLLIGTLLLAARFG